MPILHAPAVSVPSMLSNNRLHEQSLQSSALELKYERSSYIVDILAKDEDVRRLKFDMHILRDDNDELRNLLTQEEDRSNNFEVLVAENLSRAENAEARLLDVEEALRAREQDIGTLKAESKTLKSTAADSETFLTEKLALTRELSVLRPQLEHLKAQATSAEALMTEKLELQRQVTNVQCELENAKRDLKRAQAKRRNTGVEIAQEEQVEDLKRQLAKEKRARQRAEEAAENTQNNANIDDVRKELARERRARQKAEEELEASQDNTQVEDVRKELLQEKKAKAKLEATIDTLREELEAEQRAAARATKRGAEGNAELDGQLGDLRQELMNEKKERAKLEKSMQKDADEFETQKSTLDEKLGQFRAKLRTTKQKLKETEEELAAVQKETASAATESKRGRKAATSKDAQKRGAAHLDADATTLGTPGDGPPMKRGRKAPVGEKSTFSITPFLNKTTSMVADSPEALDDDAEGEKESEAVPSPIVEAVNTKKRQALTSKSVSNSNIQKKPAPRQRKQKATGSLLEMVTEEAEDVHGQGQENMTKQSQKVKTKMTDGSDPEQAREGKKKPKVRKSLVDFASFNPDPEVKKKEKKSRKLGGPGKTLFDEEEEAAPAAKALPGRALQGGRAFGALGAGTKRAGSLIGASKIGASLLMTAGDGSGFQFSPLKRKRGNLDDTLRV